MNDFTRECSTAALSIRRFPWLIVLFLAVVFFYTQEGMHFLDKGVQASNPSETELTAGVLNGSLSREIALIALGFFAVISLIRHRRARLRPNGTLGWIVLLYVGWAILSVAWAEDSGLTFRRVTVFAILCLAATAIAKRLALHEIVLLTFFCTLLFLFVGVLGEFTFGAFHPFVPGYRFAGSLGPNPQGINCALLLLSGIAAAHIERQRRALFGTCAMLGLFFLVLTGSRTALAAVIVALTLYTSLVISRSKKINLIITLILTFGIVLCLIVLLLPEARHSALQGVSVFRKDVPSASSFDGRTTIWADCLHYAYRHPLLGYGFGGFWTEGHLTEISTIESWGVAEAHSAYIDCLLSLGFVGLAIYVIVLLVGVARSLTLHRVSMIPANAFTSALLMFCTVHGFLESGIRDASFLMFLFMVILARLAFITNSTLPATTYRVGSRSSSTSAGLSKEFPWLSVRQDTHHCPYDLDRRDAL